MTTKFDVVEFPSPMELVSMIVSIVPMENLAKLQGGSTTTSDRHWFRERQCCIAALLLTSVSDVCQILFVVGIVRTIGWERIFGTRGYRLNQFGRSRFDQPGRKSNDVPPAWPSGPADAVIVF